MKKYVVKTQILVPTPQFTDGYWGNLVC